MGQRSTAPEASARSGPSGGEDPLEFDLTALGGGAEDFHRRARRPSGVVGEVVGRGLLKPDAERTLDRRLPVGEHNSAGRQHRENRRGNGQVTVMCGTYVPT